MFCKQINAGNGPNSKDKCPDSAEKPGQGRRICGGPMPKTLNLGDWCAQGLPHYSGNLTYVCKLAGGADGERVFLELGEWRGTAVGVRVNGSVEHFLAWPPFRAEIGGELQDGDNEIAITVYGHRRNAFGPFYLDETWPFWSGPLQFKQYMHSTRNLVPCGLMTPPRLVK